MHPPTHLMFRPGHQLLIYYAPIANYIRTLVPDGHWGFEFNPSVIATEFVAGYLNGGFDHHHFDGFLTSLIESSDVIGTNQDAYWDTYFKLVQYHPELKAFTYNHMQSLGFNYEHLSTILTHQYGREVYWFLDLTHPLHCLFSMGTE